MTQFVENRGEISAEDLNGASLAIRSLLAENLPEENQAAIGLTEISDDNDSILSESVENFTTLLGVWGEVVEAQTNLKATSTVGEGYLDLKIYTPATAQQQTTEINYFDDIRFLIKAVGVNSGKLIGLKSTGTANIFDFYVGSVWKQQIDLPLNQWLNMAVLYSVNDGVYSGQVKVNNESVTQLFSESSSLETEFNVAFEGASESLELGPPAGLNRVVQNAGVVLYDNISVSIGQATAYIYLVSPVQQTNYTDTQAGSLIIAVRMLENGSVSIVVE